MRYRYEYKVTDITKDNDNPTTETMGAMSLKKLQKKLDHKKLYKVEYINKKGNQLIAHISGIEPKQYINPAPKRRISYHIFMKKSITQIDTSVKLCYICNKKAVVIIYNTYYCADCGLLKQKKGYSDEYLYEKKNDRRRTKKSISR